MEEEISDFYDHDRFLAEEESIDYSVLSIGVQTLALILLVEVVRHKLDHAAKGRPLFKTVLDMIYSELSTLGLVELVVYITLKYLENYNKSMKAVFADVHFALFYTAIFNGFQSVLVAWATWQTSEKLWVKTELVELDHYVEIREEFQKIKEKLGITAEDELLHGKSGSVGEFSRHFVQSIRNPGLRGRYIDLLVRVRFHQLRLHFLEGNDLPLTLKVSEYLKRSEERVLIKLVHISGAAWLMLTGGLNLIYFFMGIVTYITEDQAIVGLSLTGIFFFMMFLFIFICSVLYFKMRSIFRTIITMEYNTNKTDTDGRDAGVKNQLSLFWFGEPNLVISIIQFMQFGYALALAIVLMYWQNLTGPIAPYWYLLTVVSCYWTFVFVLSKVLPQYTLCTSLGYLVNQKNLMETVAMHRLEEARRLQLRNQAAVDFDVFDDSGFYFDDGNNDESTPAMTMGDDSSSSLITPSGLLIDNTRSSPSNRTQLLADLVKSDTASLRNLLPEDSRESLRNREIRRARRQKSVSDGVALMRAFGVPNVAPKVSTPNFRKSVTSLDDDDILKRDRAARAERRKNRKKTMSDGVALMRALGAAASPWKEPGQTNAKTLDDSDILARDRAARAERRKHRKKTLSASAVIQSWSNMTKSESATGKRPPMDLVSFSSQVPAKHTSTEVSPTEAMSRDPFVALSPPSPSRMDQRAARIARRRQSRVKSRSESAVIQGWNDRTMPTMEESESMEGSKIPAQLEPAVMQQWKASSVTRSELESMCTIDRSEPLPELSIQDSQQAAFAVGGTKAPPPQDLQDDNKAQFFPETAEGDVHDGDKRASEDGSTVNTEASVGALSAVGDPEWEVGNLTHRSTASVSWTASLTPSKLSRSLKKYFLSSEYHKVSHFFGSLVIFFLVGQRVEVMLAATGVNQSENTWQLDLHITFWMEAAWYGFFILAAALVFLLFLPIRRKTSDQQALVAATVFDVLLSGACLALLFLAEAQRCCGEDESDIVDCCPFWGWRTYGGLGDIEPFTGLIGLRIFRFMLGRYLAKFFDKFFDENSELGLGIENGRNESSEKDSGHSSKHDVNNSMMTEVGTALELWEKAISNYPDIVEKYGQFSGELFQVMLGLEIVDKPAPKSSDLLLSPTPPDAESLLPADNSAELHAKRPERQQIKLSGKQYAELPVQTQEIILAGKLGKPVKSMGNLTALNSVTDLPALAEENDNDLLESPKQRTKTEDAAFEIDNDKLALEEKSHSNFIAPNARIVRSMRRCDRKMLPILKEWTCVDIVITQFELVYFEAVGLKDPHQKTHREYSSLLALKATAGGKGLRLQDVAHGRKVVGHFNLSDVTEIHVQRSMPMPDAANVEECAVLFDDDKKLPTELWTKPSEDTTNKSSVKQLPRNLRWAKVKEDRLNLISLNGTLVLRFYSDLDDIESHLEAASKENEAQGRLRKNIAFQWAQTITHSCGLKNLRQPLPHFGENNSDELRDLLEIAHYHEKEHDETLKTIKAAGLSLPTRKSIDLLPKPIGLRRSQSFRRSQSLGTDESTKRKGHRRGMSWGWAGAKKTSDQEDYEINDHSIKSSLGERRSSPTGARVNRVRDLDSSSIQKLPKEQEGVVEDSDMSYSSSK